MTSATDSKLDHARRAHDQAHLVAVLEDVVVRYQVGQHHLVALKATSCRVERGRQVALTGPSGSGKTTLLHVMAGLQAPTSGRVTWPALAGHPSDDPGSVGLVFQSPSLISSLDALENVALPLLLSGVPQAEAERVAAQALESVGIGDLSLRVNDQLSGGQAQRVAIARAIAPQPTLVLADEPTGQLDRETGARVITLLMQRAAANGAALVVTTHDQDVAAALPEQWVMRDGELAAGGVAS